MKIINILLTKNWLFIITLSILGLIIGSFLNVVIHRLPIILKQEHETSSPECFKDKLLTKFKSFNLVVPRSHCPECKNLISWWQNIPLVSYATLKGKCYHCKKPIHWRYPVVEILTAIATFIVAIKFGFHIQTAAMLILTWMLIAAIFIDLETMLLPDQLTLPLIWLGLLVNTNHMFTSPRNAIIGAVSGYLFLWIIAKLFKLVRKVEGMGHGDFKLFAIFGAWLGWQFLPSIVLTASFTGLVVGLLLILFKKHTMSKPLPFGPYLAIAGWLAFFIQQPVINTLT